MNSYVRFVVTAVLLCVSPTAVAKPKKAPKAAKKVKKVSSDDKSKRSKSKKSSKSVLVVRPEPNPGDGPVVLYQDDFGKGTYRIKTPGYYKLGEDIDFGPQQGNDYWPPFDLWHEYPPTAYYLGFFAAITVEADDVTIDLGGFTLRQSQEFYLLQRFFNAIELNDRVFVSNNGVSSLNYQKTDELIKGNGTRAGSTVRPTNVVIKNGVLGRSSHSGIHGNGVVGITISNVEIKEFEVSGIHCNGCKEVSIANSVVGPSMQKVPVLATFSNARFLEFYTETLIPHGFSREPAEFQESLLQLYNGTMSFGDRPDAPMSLSSIFERLGRGMQLFRSFYLRNELPEDDDDKILLDEARKVFENPTGLPDGSVVYGIVLNRFGFPATDENFFGAGRETDDVVIQNVQITGLHANPVEVAALMTEEHAFVQGPARDLVRIYDIASDQMRSLGASYYRGNFLYDSYVALWKLSNEYYTIRVFDSACGNFGSNATFAMNLKLYSSYAEPTCAQLGSKSDDSLSGRDVTMLQKRYFGGLQMTQAFYNWATTPKVGLDTLLASPPSSDDLRSGGRHHLVCDHDTMFHPMKGVVGLKIVEARNVQVSGVDITDLRNTADYQRWECGHKWQIQPTGEDIKAKKIRTSSPQASMVRGIEIVRSNDVSVGGTTIKNLVSDEGAVIALDIVGDDNDRTDHMDDEGIDFSGVSIGLLSGAIATKAISSTSTPFSTSGITYESVEEIDSSIKNPRVVLNYQAVNAGPPIPVTDPAINVLDLLMQTTDLDTLEKVVAFRQEILDFFCSQYGIRFEPNASENYGIFDIIPALDKNGGGTDSFVSGLGLLDNNSYQYHGSSLCISDAGGISSNCTDSVKAPVHDFPITFVVGSSGYTFHGAFGSDQGQFSPAGNYVACGVYSFEGLQIPGSDDDSNVVVKYFGECPIDLRPVYTQGIQSMYINCALESNIFGKGVATGIILYDFINPLMVIEGVPVPKVSGYPTMVFDDFVINPRGPTKKTEFGTGLIPYMQSNTVRFSFVADGTYKIRLSGMEVLPYLYAHHYTHEAAVEFFKRRTTYRSDDAIRNLRKEFLLRLRDQFMISVIGDVDRYDEIPLDGVIDLGGGNKIVGYAVNEYGNQRVLTKQGLPGEKTVAMPGASRLHEGGFRLVVGRAGIDTIDGRSPRGTTIMQGIYVMENGNPDGSDAEISFHSSGVVDLNSWSTSVVYHRLYHDVYGEGTLLAAQPMPKVGETGITLKICGVMIFGNV